VSGTDAIASGYLVVRAEEGAYLGGLMVTDRDGLPLDFRYTDPVTPTRLQRALYGRVLDRYPRGRLLLGTLPGSLEARPSLLIVDDRDLVGEDPGVPVAFAEATGLDPLGEVGARQDEGESGTLLQTGAARSPLRVLSAAGEVDQALAATLVALSERIDVLEPADRVRTALDVIASDGGGVSSARRRPIQGIRQALAQIGAGVVVRQASGTDAPARRPRRRPGARHRTPTRGTPPAGPSRGARRAPCGATHGTGARAALHHHRRRRRGATGPAGPPAAPPRGAAGPGPRPRGPAVPRAVAARFAPVGRGRDLGPISAPGSSRAAILGRPPARRPRPLPERLRRQRRHRAEWAALPPGVLRRGWRAVARARRAPAFRLTLVGVYGPLRLGRIAAAGPAPDGIRLEMLLQPEGADVRLGYVALARDQATGRTHRASLVANGSRVQASDD